MQTRRMMVLALLAGIAPNSMFAQNKPQTHQRWIEALKATPVVSFEAGMPEKPLGEWLVDNAKSSEVQYTVEPCEGNDGPSCIRVTTLQGSVVLKFVISASQGQPQTGRFTFWGGWEGPPPGSPMKRPTRKISKLSELRTMLHWD
jgi:hypothetical protein